LERKFNPWHDPEDGRFTFAGGGQYVGRRGSGSASRGPQDKSKSLFVIDKRKAPITTIEQAKALRAELLAKYGDRLGYREKIEELYDYYKKRIEGGRSLSTLGKLAGNLIGPDPGPGEVSANSSGQVSLSPGQIGREPDSPEAPGGATDISSSPGFSGGGGSFGGGGMTGSWDGTSFSGGGASFGGGGTSGSWDGTSFSGGGASFGGGGTSGSWNGAGFSGGGGSFGGGGASGSWNGTGFSGGGSFGGGGASGDWNISNAINQRESFRGRGATGNWTPKSPVSNPRSRFPNRANSSFDGAGATGSWDNTHREVDKFGGAGASGNWSNSNPNTAHSARDTVASPRGQVGVNNSRQLEQFRSVERNGYEYKIDSAGRTRQVSGTLTLSGNQVRSRTAQARAGASDRRKDDDGGHYIAARFNGPRDAFNHFAQNANFNRGAYRQQEDEWAQAQRAGKRVTVNIVPHYEGSSQRPSRIDVLYNTDGYKSSKIFWNGYKGINDGEQ
jgi:hypothetical protein